MKVAVLSVALLFSILLCCPAQAKVRHQPNMSHTLPFLVSHPTLLVSLQEFPPGSILCVLASLPKRPPTDHSQALSFHGPPPRPLPFFLASAALSPDTIPGLTPNSQTLSQSCRFCPRLAPFFCPHQAPPLHSHVPTPQFLSPALYLTPRPFHGPSPVPWLLSLPQLSVFGSPPAPNTSPWRP